MASEKSPQYDEAYDFLKHHEATSHSERTDTKRLRRKIDWHIVPLMFLCYAMSFLDKVLLNVGVPVSLCSLWMADMAGSMLLLWASRKTCI